MFKVDVPVQYILIAGSSMVRQVVKTHVSQRRVTDAARSEKFELYFGLVVITGASRREGTCWLFYEATTERSTILSVSRTLLRRT